MPGSPPTLKKETHSLGCWLLSRRNTEMRLGPGEEPRGHSFPTHSKGRRGETAHDLGGLLVQGVPQSNRRDSHPWQEGYRSHPRGHPQSGTLRPRELYDQLKVARWVCCKEENCRSVSTGRPKKVLDGEPGGGGSLFSISPAPCVIWHHLLGLWREGGPPVTQ